MDANGIETTTWFDQSPSHKVEPDEVYTARLAMERASRRSLGVADRYEDGKASMAEMLAAEGACAEAEQAYAAVRQAWQDRQADALTLTRSERMKVYNKARAAARRGEFKASVSVVNKSFSLLQRPAVMAEKFAEYHTTTRSCDCTAGQYRRICYHRTALMEVEQVRRWRQAAAAL